MSVRPNASRIFVQESVIKVLVMVAPQNGKINGTDATWRFLSEFWNCHVLLEGKLEDKDSLAK